MQLVNKCIACLFYVSNMFHILQAYTQFPVALTWDQSVPNLDHFGKDLLQVTFPYAE